LVLLALQVVWAVALVSLDLTRYLDALPCRNATQPHTTTLACRAETP